MEMLCAKCRVKNVNCESSYVHDVHGLFPIDEVNNNGFCYPKLQLKQKHLGSTGILLKRIDYLIFVIDHDWSIIIFSIG